MIRIALELNGEDIGSSNEFSPSNLPKIFKLQSASIPIFRGSYDHNYAISEYLSKVNSFSDLCSTLSRFSYKEMYNLVATGKINKLTTNTIDLNISSKPFCSTDVLNTEADDIIILYRFDGIRIYHASLSDPMYYNKSFD